MYNTPCIIDIKISIKSFIQIHDKKRKWQIELTS